MRDQHRPKQDLINEVTGLRKQIADLREAMTARRRVEDALRQSPRNSSAMLVDAAPVGLCLFRPDGTPLAANRPFARLLGYDSASELLQGRGHAGCVREPGGAVPGPVAGRARARAGGGRRLPPEGRHPRRRWGHRLGRDDSQALVLVVLERQPQPWRSAPLAALSPAWSAGIRSG